MGMPRILITEDDEPSRKALATVFEKNGWEVVQAGTVAEGLAALHAVPDCVILDLVLPDGEGETILRKVRADEISIRVVIVATGKDDPNRLGRVAALKPDLLVLKPIGLETIWRYFKTRVRRAH
jgi:DNA-binding response OmpR family regulator